MTIPMTWVDAFSDVAFGGNPAAVCLLREPLDDARMQSIAFELGIAETAYLTPSDDPTVFGLRWFSPAVEIDLCGHATLASAHALREGGHVDGTAPLTFHTRSGPLRASFAGDTIELDFPADPMVPGPLDEELVDEWPGDVVASGRTGFFAFVVLSSADAVRAYEPDLEAIAATGAKALLLTAAAGRRTRVPTTSCASSGPTWGSTRTPPREQPSAWPARTGRPSWAGTAWWPTSSPGAGRRSTCVPTVTGSSSAGTPPPS